MSIEKYYDRQEFFKLLRRLHRARKRYSALLKEAEEAYELRYGNNPSEVYDDNWIDTFHIGVSDTMKPSDIENKAVFYNKKADSNSDDLL